MMPLWDRLFPRKPSTSKETYAQIVEPASLRLLAAASGQSGDLRQTKAVGDLLALFWSDDPQALRAIQTVLSSLGQPIDLAFLEDLARRARGQSPVLPETSEARYAVIASLLGALLHAFWPQRRREDAAEEAIPRSRPHLADAVRTIQHLQVVDLHGDCCDLLVAIDALLSQRQDLWEMHLAGAREGAFTVWLENVRYALHRCLATLPPDRMPRFWESVQAKDIGEEFWPILTRIRDRRAVPFLVASLPSRPKTHGLRVASPQELPTEGQAAVITALQNIGDVQAIPVLQALASDETSPVASIAERAITQLLRTSPDAAAQLLRSTEAPTDGLLRPADPERDAHRSGSLLRPDERPSRENDER
jgi:hypothetical protein